MQQRHTSKQLFVQKVEKWFFGAGFNCKFGARSLIAARDLEWMSLSTSCPETSPKLHNAWRRSFSLVLFQNKKSQAFVIPFVNHRQIGSLFTLTVDICIPHFRKPVKTVVWFSVFQRQLNLSPEGLLVWTSCDAIYNEVTNAASMPLQGGR